jgi:transglutaminase/protease-like cytokinesis protein 3
MKKKRLLSLLCAAMLMFLLPVNAFAAETIKLPSVKSHLPYYLRELSETEQSAYMTLRQTAMDHGKSVTFDAKKVDQDFLNTAISILLQYDSLTFDVDTVSTYSSGYKRNGVLDVESYRLEIEYKLSKSNYQKALSRTDKAAKAFLATLDEDDGTLQKVMDIHDYIIKSCDYDLDYSLGYTAYGALVGGKALCEGYAYAFNYICEDLGIPSVMAVSDPKNGEVGHAWNKFKAGKNWYVVDVTNDDTDAELYGNISRAYLFLADSEYTAAEESDDPYVTEPQAKDTSRDFYEQTDRKFADLSSAISYVNKKLSPKDSIPCYIEFEAGSSKIFKSFLDDIQGLLDDTLKTKKLRTLQIYYTTVESRNVIHLYFYQ